MSRFAPLLLLYVLAGVLLQPAPVPVGDEPALLAAAERLWQHGQLTATGAAPDQRAYLWHGPGLVAVLAPLVALDVPLWAIRLLTGPLLLGAALILFHRLLCKRLAPRPALVASYAFGLYAPFAMVLGRVHKEPLAILLVVAAMLALTRWLEHGRWFALAGAGLALTALTMVRLEYGWVAAVLLGLAAVWWALRRGRPVARRAARRTVAVAAMGVTMCVPWLAYTYAETRQPLYWGASAGLSLFWMSPTLPGESGEWHSPLRVYGDPALAVYRPLFRRLDDVHPLASDLELRRRAVANITGEPLRYAGNLLANTSRLFFAAPMRPPRTPLVTSWTLLVAGCVLFNGLLLVATAWAARRLWRRRRSLAPESAPFAAFALLAIVVHLPPSASPRMLLPVVPVLVWLIAQAAVRPGSGPALGRLRLAIGPRRLAPSG